jgi:hypothetical protein
MMEIIQIETYRMFGMNVFDLTDDLLNKRLSFDSIETQDNTNNVVLIEYLGLPVGYLLFIYLFINLLILLILIFQLIGYVWNVL